MSVFLSVIFATGRSLIQSSPTDCGVSSECDLETLSTRRPLPTRALKPWGKKSTTE